MGSGKETEYQKFTCAHCLRQCGTFAGGFARIDGLPVCSKPPVPGRPDCYREITAHAHPLQHCRQCVKPAEPDPVKPPFTRLRMGSHSPAV